MAKKEFVIGISVIACIVILIFGIDYLKGINLFSPANFYYASYENVSDLSVSAPVTIKGYKVGQVRNIEFDYDHPGKIKVQLALNKSLKLPKDTKAKMGTTLMSGSYIELELGNSKEYLPIGSNLAVEDSPELMTTIKNELMPAVTDVIPKIDSIINNVNALTGNAALIATLERLDAISANLLETSVALNRTMGRDVPGIIHHAGSIAIKVDSVATDLQILSGQLKSLPFDATMQNLETLTSNLNDFSIMLKNPDSSLGKLTTDPELYNRLNRVAADVDSLIIDIKKNPKRYVSIKLL